jgi:hypothetical protein
MNFLFQHATIAHRPNWPRACPLTSGRWLPARSQIGLTARIPDYDGSRFYAAAMASGAIGGTGTSTTRSLPMYE